MNQNIIETVVGIVVMIIAIGCVVIAYQSGTIHHEKAGYKLMANFTNADGLHVGSKVRIGGVDVGLVDVVGFDPSSYKAKITFSVQDDVKLPTDSSASIISSGLLGEKYLSITPGADSDDLKPNSSIQFTQASINLEELLGKFMFGSANNKVTK